VEVVEKVEAADSEDSSSESSSESESDSSEERPLVQMAGGDSPAPQTAQGLTTNFIFMSLAFGLNHACVTSLIAIAAPEFGAELGSYGTGTLYLTYTATCAFLSHAVVAALGHKYTLILGLWTYCVYVVGYLVAAILGSGQGQWVAVIVGGLAGGFAAGFLWPAQGSYFATTSKLYANAVGVSVKDANARFSGLFATVYLATELVMKIMTSTVLRYGSDGPAGKASLYVIFSVVSIASAITMMFVSPLTPAPHTAAAVRKPFDWSVLGKQVTSAGRLFLFDPKCALMLPMNFTFGFASVYLNSYVAAEVLDHGDAIDGANAAYLSAILVATATAMSPVFGHFGKTTRRKTYIAMLGSAAFGCFVFAYAIHTVAFQRANLGSWQVLVPMYMLYGVGRCAWEGSFKGTFADFFPNDTPAAFANVQLQSGLASTIGFFVFPKLKDYSESLSGTGVSGYTILAIVTITSAALSALAQPLAYIIYTKEEKIRELESKTVAAHVAAVV